SQDGPYTSCTGTSVTGLSKGTYYVRVKETETVAAGGIATVKIGEKSGLTPTNTNTPTPVPQNTTEPTQTPIPTDTPVPTESAGDSPTPLPTSDPGSVVTPTPTPAVTQGTEPTSTPTTAPGNTATVTPTATPTASTGPAVTSSPAPTAAGTLTPSPSATPSVTDAGTSSDASEKTGENKLENIKISEIRNSKKGVTLTWNSCADAKSYNILKSTDGKKFTLAASVDAAVTSYVDKKTVNGKTYSYKIEAVNGKLWSQSEVVSICRLNTVKVKKKSSSKGSAYLKWKKNPKASGYQIRYVLNGKVKTVNVKSAKKISRTIKKLKSKKKYVFSVRAYKKAGQINYYGDWSKTYKIKIK
ncbi:MAG: fibronectin type III domain-containing protein, partial [Clostridiales bacterium]|nr:fibronectin type III domain-containing protein [Clostridiales bacterium]